MMSRPSARKRYDPLTGSNEYSVVRFRLSWGLLSLVVFVYSLPVRYWLQFLPWHPFQYLSRPGTMVLSTFALSVLGMITAWIGMRSNDTPKGLSISKVGLFLNGAVFSILLLAVLSLVVYWRILR